MGPPSPLPVTVYSHDKPNVTAGKYPFLLSVYLILEVLGLDNP